MIKKINENLKKYKYVLVRTTNESDIANTVIYFVDDFRKLGYRSGYLFSTDDVNIKINIKGDDYHIYGIRLIISELDTDTLYYDTPQEVIDKFPLYNITIDDIKEHKNCVITFTDCFIHLFRFKKFYHNMYTLKRDLYIKKESNDKITNIVVNRNNLVVLYDTEVKK